MRVVSHDAHASAPFESVLGAGHGVGDRRAMARVATELLEDGLRRGAVALRT
jgi:hypothetical protein